MENDKIIKLAAVTIVGVVLIPIVWNTSLKIISGTAQLIANANFKRKIKKGIKEGSIVEIDGKFYEIDVETTAEEA